MSRMMCEWPKLDYFISYICISTQTSEKINIKKKVIKNPIFNWNWIRCCCCIYYAYIICNNNKWPIQMNGSPKWNENKLFSLIINTQHLPNVAPSDIINHYHGWIRNDRIIGAPVVRFYNLLFTRNVCKNICIFMENFFFLFHRFFSWYSAMLFPNLNNNKLYNYDESFLTDCEKNLECELKLAFRVIIIMIRLIKKP